MGKRGFTETEEYKKLRQEFVSEKFRKSMIKILGSKCCNCESTENIEYHHVVPLAFGGTNRLSNIKPLCPRCHLAVHRGKHMNEFRKQPEKTGRPRKWPLTDESEKHIWRWAKGEIGTRELKELVGMKKSIHLPETQMYEQFVEKHGISRIRNYRDMLTIGNNWRSKSCGIHRVSKIQYLDGREEEYEADMGEREGVKPAFKISFDDVDDDTRIIDTAHGSKYVFRDKDGTFPDSVDTPKSDSEILYDLRRDALSQYRQQCFEVI